MRIAVLMSTYNGEKYIKEQIDSILEQKVDGTVELIVRDDGSNDHTCAILEEYAQKGLLRWYTGENLRAPRSFITLIRDNPGYDFYAYADQDDYWYPNKMSMAVKQIGETEKPSLYYSNAEIVDEALNSVGRNVYRKEPPKDGYSMICCPSVQGCTAVFNAALASVIQEHPMPEVVTMHDSYIGRVCSSIGGTLIFDMEPHMKYRIHQSNVEGIKTSKQNSAVSIIKERIADMKTKESISIAQQAEEILRLYAELIQDNYKLFYGQVVGYQKTLFRRLRLAFSIKVKHTTLNLGVTNRMKILLGNK